MRGGEHKRENSFKILNAVTMKAVAAAAAATAAAAAEVFWLDYRETGSDVTLMT